MNPKSLIFLMLLCPLGISTLYAQSKSHFSKKLKKRSFESIANKIHHHQDETSAKNMMDAISENQSITLPTHLVLRILRHLDPKFLHQFGMNYLIHHHDLVVKSIQKAKPYNKDDVTSLKGLIKYVLCLEPFLEWEKAQIELLNFDSKSILVRLQRYVLIKALKRHRPISQLLLATSTISSHVPRMMQWDRALGYFRSADVKAIDSFLTSTIYPPAPEGYTIKKHLIGSGKSSLVHLIYRDIDGKEFAWKLPNTDAYRSYASFFEENDKAEIWSEIGYGVLTEIDLRNKRIIQEFVKGKTLRKTLNSLKTPTEFLEDFNEPMTFQLAKMILEFTAQKVFIPSLNYENIIYNGQTWLIIDSGKPKKESSFAATFETWKKSSIKNWTRQDNFVHLEKIKRFFSILEPIAAQLSDVEILKNTNVRRMIENFGKYRPTLLNSSIETKDEHCIREFSQRDPY